jgi:hypothetical protein
MIRKQFEAWKAKSSKAFMVVPGDRLKDGQIVFWGGETVDGHPIVYAIQADESGGEAGLVER